MRRSKKTAISRKRIDRKVSTIESMKSNENSFESNKILETIQVSLSRAGVSIEIYGRKVLHAKVMNSICSDIPSAFRFCGVAGFNSK